METKMTKQRNTFNVVCLIRKKQGDEKRTGPSIYSYYCQQ